MLDLNLKHLRKQHQISQQELADAMEIPRSTLGDYERGKTEPNIALLLKMAGYFDISIDTLVAEKIYLDDLRVAKNEALKILAITVDSNNRGNIELVDTKAEAGYLDSFQDPEYIRELPKIRFPGIPSGTYRGFEIQGDSMLPMEPGSIIICSFVERIEHIKDDRTYIIVSKRDGLVYKRVKRDDKSNQLLLNSDNEVFLPYTIDYEDVNEVWEYYAHLSFSDAKTSVENALQEKLDDIQRKVTALHAKHI